MLIQEKGIWELVCRRADGSIKWQGPIRNTLAQEGQQHILDVYLRGATGATTFYLGATDSTSPSSVAKDDSLADVVGYGEPSGGGYSRQEIEHSSTGWPSLSIPTGETDYQAISKVVTIQASGGDIGPFYTLFLTDAVSGTTGKHLAFAAITNQDFLDGGATLNDGESLDVTFKIMQA